MVAPAVGGLWRPMEVLVREGFPSDSRPPVHPLRLELVPWVARSVMPLPRVMQKSQVPGRRPLNYYLRDACEAVQMQLMLATVYSPVEQRQTDAERVAKQAECAGKLPRPFDA